MVAPGTSWILCDAVTAACVLRTAWKEGRGEGGGEVQGKEGGGGREGRERLRNGVGRKEQTKKNASTGNHDNRGKVNYADPQRLLDL